MLPEWSHNDLFLKHACPPPLWPDITGWRDDEGGRRRLLTGLLITRDSEVLPSAPTPQPRRELVAQAVSSCLHPLHLHRPFTARRRCQQPAHLLTLKVQHMCVCARVCVTPALLVTHVDLGFWDTLRVPLVFPFSQWVHQHRVVQDNNVIYTEVYLIFQ